MATAPTTPPKLLEKAAERSGEPTETAAATLAPEEVIARRQQARLIELFGSLDWDPELDYKAERSRT